MKNPLNALADQLVEVREKIEVAGNMPSCVHGRAAMKNLMGQKKDVLTEIDQEIYEAGFSFTCGFETELEFRGVPKQVAA